LTGVCSVQPSVEEKLNKSEDQHLPALIEQGSPGWPQQQLTAALSGHVQARHVMYLSP